MSKNRKVIVEIGGTSYKILTDLDDEAIKWIQDYINERLHEIQKGAFFQLDQERAYFYTALNLAEEIYKLRNELDKLKGELVKLTKTIKDEMKDERE